VWEKVRQYERQRFLGLLFGAAMAGLLIYVLLATNFRGLNRVFGIILLLVFVDDYPADTTPLASPWHPGTHWPVVTR